MPVGAIPTAAATPGVRRASVTVASGTPAGAVTTRSASWRSRAWSAVSASCVVPENSSVQPIATLSTSGVIAEATRRGAVLVAAVARKPPTGEILATRRPGTTEAARATSGPRHAAATTRTSETPLAAASAVSWFCDAVATESSIPPPAAAMSPASSRARPIMRGSTAASWSARVGATFDARRDPAQAAARAQGRWRRRSPAADDPAGHLDAFGREAAFGEGVDQLVGERHAGEVAGG